MADGNNLPAFPAAPGARPGKKTLAGVIGTAAGAALLFVMVPKEESGGHVYLHAYRDIVGVVTICDGDTTNVRMGTVETPEGCRQRLERQLVAHAEPLIACAPPLKGRANQVAASVSLAYNIGSAGFCRGSVALAINRGDWAAASNAFLLYNRAGGRVNRGLDGRRHREKAVFDRERPQQGVL